MSAGFFASGALFAAIVAALALRARALDFGGAAAAWAVGSLTFGAGGWPFTLVLLAFFLPSIALSRVGRARKRQLVDIGKGGARDCWQVLANGGVATVCAVMAGALGGAEAWIAAFSGAYAAATADTWGTEIGTLVRGTPRSIFTGKPIATGLSGGVTLAGSLAEIGGALWIGGCTIAAVTSMSDRDPALVTIHRADVLFAASAAGGIVGALLDSVLGATLQELRYCATCDRQCETDPHVCGRPTVRVRGIRGFSNDVVNGAATFGGAVTAFIIMRVQ